MATPKPPKRFKRSAERGTDEKAARQYAFGNAREEDRALADYEEIWFTQSAASQLVEPVRRKGDD